MDVAIHHSLDTGLGEADLKVPGIRFDEGLQPEELTPLTQGVIALVTADVEGVGRIAWGGPEVVSTGTFDISDADFAASFGPVEGLDTRIVFTDLLNLVTGPGQRLTVDLVNPGIPVNDGVVTYQLLPGQLVKVERGLWPFMGGQLILRETILNFGAPADKRLTFELIAFDSALFVERLEFDNTVRMTGIFDGVIPTIFDEDGGRLVGGRLDAREGGGTIEYVGSLGKLSLGPRLAASVLRSIAYEKMIVRLDGDLDGEFATRMDIDGVRLGETTAARIVRQVSNIPVNLNVTISGPFRALIATMRSFDDPKPLIADVLPGPLENIPDALIETRRLRHEKDSEPAPDRAEDQPLPDVRKEDMP
nr:YdbH domain-containing protein [Sphingomicrobium lutaoense]